MAVGKSYEDLTENEIWTAKLKNSAEYDRLGQLIHQMNQSPFKDRLQGKYIDITETEYWTFVTRNNLIESINDYDFKIVIRDTIDHIVGIHIPNYLPFLKNKQLVGMKFKNTKTPPTQKYLDHLPSFLLYLDKKSLTTILEVVKKNHDTYTLIDKKDITDPASI